MLRVGPARGLVVDSTWALYAPPRSDAWLLDADRRPRTSGRSALSVEVLGWVVARGARGDVALSRCLQILSGAELLRGMALAWRSVPAVEGDVDGADTRLAREETLLSGATLTLAVGAAQPDVAVAVTAYAALWAQGSRGAPSPFVGEGRWWVPTLREAVARALRTGVDGGAL